MSFQSFVTVVNRKREERIGFCKFHEAKETRPKPIVLGGLIRGVEDSEREAMGSTSTSSAALIHHFRLTSRNLSSPKKRPYAVNFCNSWREAGLRYGVTRRWSRDLGPVVRLAALDEKSDNSPTETTPGVGSAVEDRPGFLFVIG